MCPGLRGESGTEQETNRSSPGCADPVPLCNLGAASRPSADTAKLLAGTRFCLFFPSARRQAEENLGGLCEWAESAGQQQALRWPRRGLVCPSTPDGQAGSQQRPRGDYHRVWNGEETQLPRSPIALPSCCHLHHPHPARSCQVPPPALPHGAGAAPSPRLAPKGPLRCSQ